RHGRSAAGLGTLSYRRAGRALRLLVPQIVPRKLITCELSIENMQLTALSEPPIGIEPMTYALREARFPALGARPALMQRLVRSGCPECPEFHPLPVHDPVHDTPAQDPLTRLLTVIGGADGTPYAAPAPQGSAEKLQELDRGQPRLTQDRC